MSELMKSMTVMSCAALLAACGAIGGGQKSEGGTHTLTGGAEAAPTSEATPQPARPRGDTQRGMTGTTPGGETGGAAGASTGATPGSSGATGGDATTGGAEAAPTTEGTPPAPSSGSSPQGGGGAGGLYDQPGGLQAPRY